METDKTRAKLLIIILKNISTKQTITSLAEETKMSRPGIWKLLKKLKKDELIEIEQIGKGKTSMQIIKLNWKNILLERTLILYLTQEAVNYERWRVNFSELEKYADFLILYGSILHSPKEANDIDIIGVVSKKKNFSGINEIISKIQRTQLKKLHSLNFTNVEFKEELRKPNKAFVDAIKKGIILFGQEKFIKFMRGFSHE